MALNFNLIVKSNKARVRGTIQNALASAEQANTRRHRRQGYIKEEEGEEKDVLQKVYAAVFGKLIVRFMARWDLQYVETIVQRGILHISRRL